MNLSAAVAAAAAVAVVVVVVVVVVAVRLETVRNRVLRVCKRRQKSLGMLAWI